MLLEVIGAIERNSQSGWRRKKVKERILCQEKEKRDNYWEGGEFKACFLVYVVTEKVCFKAKTREYAQLLRDN